MKNPTFPLPSWASAGWETQASAWIDENLARLNRRQEGSLSEVRSTPWSLVLLIPTSAGNLYFKAVAPNLHHEIRLTQALSAWHPEYTLPVLAAQPERGWMLLPDAGENGGDILRSIIRATRQPDPWREILPLYARLQQQLAPRAGELLALGLPDRRLARLPDLYASLIEDLPMLRIDQENGLTSAQLGQLHAHKPLVAEYCRRLAAYPIPEGFNHGDFHNSNVFVQQDRFVFFDWGDASLTHPFISMRTVLVSLEIHLEWEDNDPRGAPFAEIYLQSWQDYAPLAELRAAYALSRCLAPIISALSWHYDIAGLPDEQRAPYAHAVPGLLGEFLEYVQDKS